MIVQNIANGVKAVQINKSVTVGGGKGESCLSGNLPRLCAVYPSGDKRTAGEVFTGLFLITISHRILFAFFNPLFMLYFDHDRGKREVRIINVKPLNMKGIL